jgi:hypothetical protein
MFKVFLVLALFSSVAFAEDPRIPILEKHALSGYVPPEFRFKKDCRIFADGSVEIQIVEGETGSGSTAHISMGKIAEIRRYVNFARFFPISSGAVICDAGTITVTGHRKGVSVLIKERLDCHSNKWRQGYPASRLRAIATKLCGF